MNRERNIKQIRLKEFGVKGQYSLEKSSVLVVGAGGLGIPVCQYLNAMGIGTLGIIDGDVIEMSNLHRQPLYEPDTIGLSKVHVLRSCLNRQNPDTDIRIYETFLGFENALDILKNYQLIIDATDNLTTRYLIDDAALILNIPWIYGALHGFEGQVSVFNYNHGPTYRCLFPDLPNAGEIPDCNTMGTLGVLPGIIGNLQALEAVKVIAGLPGILSGKVLMYNGLDQEIRQLKIKKNPNRSIPNAELKPNTFVCDSASAGIMPEHWIQHINNGARTCIVDVREPEEFKADHLYGAVNIPLLELRNRLDEIPTEKHVLLVCKSGPRSIQAYRFIQNMSQNIQSNWLIGGLTAYRKKNL
ncbi:MAG: hypothetical protein RLZZ241_651 [Bacteroidota bacterium]